MNIINHTFLKEDLASCNKWFDSYKTGTWRGKPECKFLQEFRFRSL